MTAITIPVIKKRVPITIVILALLVVVGFYAMMVRWISGLGVATNLADTRPWGLWISFDVLVMAVSAAAFTMAAVVHIFHREEYHPILRVSLLGGYVGYLVAGSALTVELGRPERLWHFLVYWNVHSPLFEVGMCVMTYTAILTLEFLPLIFERFELKGLAKALHKISTPVVIAGITLSTGHQSSLGSLYLILPYKLHPLWHTPLLPVIFFLSAVTAGVGMVIFEGLLGNRIFGWNIEKDVFQGLAKGLLVALIVVLITKIGDLAYAGELGLIFEGSLQSNMFILENIIGYLLPIGVLLVPGFRRNLPWIFRAGFFAVTGLVLHRFNVSYLGLAGAPYTPHWLEVASTAGLFSVGLILYWLAVSHLPVCENGEGAH